jgi:hypothetical protein
MTYSQLAKFRQNTKALPEKIIMFRVSRSGEKSCDTDSRSGWRLRGPVQPLCQVSLSSHVHLVVS